jgi:hypothetical protein
MDIQTTTLDTAAPPAQAPVVTMPSQEKPKIRVGTPSEQALIQRMEREMRVPSWLREGWEQWQADRDYVGITAFALGDSRSLGVNLAARAIQAKLTRIRPDEADLSVKQERSVGSIDWARKDAIRAADQTFRQMGANPDPQALILAAEEAERNYRLLDERRERFAVTGETVVAKQMKSCNITKFLERCAMATFTCSIAWAKTGWQSDYTKDSMGRRRQNDSQDQIALLHVRAGEFAAGYFTEGDAKYQEYMDLSDYARQQAVGAINGAATPDPRLLDVASLAETQPGSPVPQTMVAEPERWQAPTIDFVRPENMRWDWRVSPANHAEGDWVAEQILMDRDEAAGRLGLTPEEAGMLGSGYTWTTQDNLKNPRLPGTEPPEPGTSDYESSAQNGKVVVWDRCDFKTGRRYMWAAGLSFLHINEPLPMYDEIRSPYECLIFNEFDGMPLPISEIRFLRKIQDAINQRLTDENESLWASMKRYIVKAGAFTPEELAKMRGSTPHDVMECIDPVGIKESWMAISSDDWDATKYSLDGLFRLFELVMNMSMSELGVVQVANTATEANIADQQSQASSDRHAAALADFDSRIANKFLHMDAAYLGQKQVARLCGSTQVVWPSPQTREELIYGMRLEVSAAGNRRQAKGREVANLNSALDILRKIFAAKAEGAMVGEELDVQALAAPALRLADVRGPAREAIKSKPAAAPQQPQMPPQGQPGQPGATEQHQSPGATTRGLPPPSMPTAPASQPMPGLPRQGLER